jgi:hypothetical protein
MSNQFSMKTSNKPLKGQTVTSNYGVFDTVSANNLILESISIAGVFEDGMLLNVTIKDSNIINTVIGVEGANVGYFTQLQSSETVTFLGDAFGSYVSWDPIDSTFTINGGTFKVEGCSYLDNIEICRNDIKATNLNGDINLYPNGLGTLYLNGPVYNKTSNGNYYTEVNQGSVTFSAKNNILLSSSSGSAFINTFSNQSFTTTNGDISLTTEERAIITDKNYKYSAISLIESDIHDSSNSGSGSRGSRETKLNKKIQTKCNEDWSDSISLRELSEFSYKEKKHMTFIKKRNDNTKFFCIDTIAIYNFIVQCTNKNTPPFIPETKEKLTPDEIELICNNVSKLTKNKKDLLETKLLKIKYKYGLANYKNDFLILRRNDLYRMFVKFRGVTWGF